MYLGVGMTVGVRVGVSGCTWQCIRGCSPLPHTEAIAGMILTPEMLPDDVAGTRLQGARGS